MHLIKKEKYPFLDEIVQCNHDYLYKFENDIDFDSYIVLMNLYMYTCKYMNHNGIILTKSNIYQNMEYLFSNSKFRTKLIKTFSDFSNNFNDTNLKLSN